MPAVDKMELYVRSPLPKSLVILYRHIRRIILILPTRDVQKSRGDRLVRPCFPVARQAPTDSYHPANGIWISCGKAIVQRHRLGETDEEAARWRNVIFLAYFVQDVRHHFVMQADGLCCVPIGNPAVTNFSIRLAAEKLIRSLERSEYGFNVEQSLGQLEHRLWVLSETVECHYERRFEVHSTRLSKQVKAVQPRGEATLLHIGHVSGLARTDGNFYCEGAKVMAFFTDQVEGVRGIEPN